MIPATSAPGIGPEPEDAFSFTSAVFGALASTIQQQGNPKTLLLALVLAAFAKALPSLGQSLNDPVKKKDVTEDLILFFAAALATLGAGIQSNFTFSTSPSQEILVLGLAAGLAGKAIPSLISLIKGLRGQGGKGILKNGFEDWVPLVASVASALAVVPWGPQYASVGIFLGFLAKQLLPTPTAPAPTPQPTAPATRPTT